MRKRTRTIWEAPASQKDLKQTQSSSMGARLEVLLGLGIGLDEERGLESELEEEGLEPLTLREMDFL